MIQIYFIYRSIDNNTSVLIAYTPNAYLANYFIDNNSNEELEIMEYNCPEDEKKFEQLVLNMFDLVVNLQDLRLRTFTSKDNKYSIVTTYKIYRDMIYDRHRTIYNTMLVFTNAAFLLFLLTKFIYDDTLSDIIMDIYNNHIIKMPNNYFPLNIATSNTIDVLKVISYADIRGTINWKNIIKGRS